MGALTTVPRVLAYQGSTSNNAQVVALMGRLVVAASAQAERWCGRKLSDWATYTKRLNGTGTSRLVLPDTPILSVASLTIASQAIEYKADPSQGGFSYDDTCIYLAAERFPYVPQIVAAEWDSGWRQAETQTIPTGNAPTITPAGGELMVSVANVVAANGSAFAAAASNAPAAGEYYFNTSAGSLLFNTADANTSVTFTYGLVPPDVEQAVIEMVVMDTKQRDNIGIKSRTLAQETVVYDDRGMSSSVKSALEPYRKRVPV